MRSTLHTRGELMALKIGLVACICRHGGHAGADPAPRAAAMEARLREVEAHCARLNNPRRRNR